MSERKKPHNGRDRSGHFRVKQEDVEDLRTDPDGADIVEDDVRLGGAIADIGPQAGQRGEHIGDLVEMNRENVAQATGRTRPGSGRGRSSSRRR
jgi:hypothetical protein